MRGGEGSGGWLSPRAALVLTLSAHLSSPVCAHSKRVHEIWIDTSLPRNATGYFIHEPRLIMLEGLLSFLGVSGSAAGAHSFGRIIAGLTATLTPLSLSWWPVLIACAVMAAFLLALTVVLDASTVGERGRPGE